MNRFAAMDTCIELIKNIENKGYVDKDNPGLRYNIYTLDYGTYVDLVNTALEPSKDFTEGLLIESPHKIESGLFLEEQKVDELIVPFDDKRSIRRIILTKEILERKDP